jgi:hypothetical protein
VRKASLTARSAPPSFHVAVKVSLSLSSLYSHAEHISHQIVPKKKVDSVEGYRGRLEALKELKHPHLGEHPLPPFATFSTINAFGNARLTLHESLFFPN